MNFTNTLQNNRMGDFSWSEFLAGSAVAKVVEEVVKYRRRKLETKFDLAENLAEIAKLHHCMEDVVSSTFFERFLILKAEDSAGVLAAGKKLFVSVQYEKTSKDNEILTSVSSLIQRWEADHYYYKMFSEMLSGEKVCLKVSEMPNCKLKDIYLMQGVQYCEVGHLMTTKDSSLVFYYSVATTVKSEPKAEDRAILEGNISIIKNIFAKHRKFY